MPEKRTSKIRPLAICVFRDGDRIFVSQDYDFIKNQTFYRPLGGRIKFGERAIDTARREIMEEIQQEITDLRYLGTLENIFLYNGKPGHEIMMIFEGRFVDPGIYERELVEGYENNDANKPDFVCVWKTTDYFRNGYAPLYPDGLLELLDR